MMRFKSWNSYSVFSREIERERRFVRTQEAEEFLRVVAATCKERLQVIPKGRRLWRAQLGNCWRQADKSTRFEEPIAYGTLRMKPMRDSAIEGRTNPKGIPYLYLS